MNATVFKLILVQLKSPLGNSSFWHVTMILGSLDMGSKINEKSQPMPHFVKFQDFQVEPHIY